MDNPAFGRFVRSLRRQRHFTDERDNYRQWTQAKLARESGLSVKQVASIEQGLVIDLAPHLDKLERLADALGLNQLEKAAFFARAGFAYPLAYANESKEFLRTLLEQLHFPSAIRTPLWDFVGFNTYHKVLWGYSNTDIAELNQGRLGPNLLRVLFKGEFRGQTDVRRPHWQSEAVRAFRASSFPYSDTQRYREIVDEMSNHAQFERAWQLLETKPGKQDEEQEHVMSRRPLTRISHPEFGEMEFISMRIPKRYYGGHIGGDYDVSVYIPVKASEEAFWELRRFMETNNMGNSVYFFDERPLD